MCYARNARMRRSPPPFFRRPIQFQFRHSGSIETSKQKLDSFQCPNQTGCYVGFLSKSHQVWASNWIAGLQFLEGYELTLSTLMHILKIHEKSFSETQSVCKNAYMSSWVDISIQQVLHPCAHKKHCCRCLL